MRRTFALLALLATSWPHAVALECALASAAPAAPAEAGHHGGHAGEHAGMSHGHSPESHAAGSEHVPVGGGDCALVMACGLVMIQTEGERASTERASAPEPHVFTPLDTPTAAVLVADPPPPRRNA